MCSSQIRLKSRIKFFEGMHKMTMILEKQLVLALGRVTFFQEMVLVKLSPRRVGL